MSWVLNAYAIVYAALLVLVGRLSEGRSRQNGFLLGALIFTVASAACGAAPNLTMLIVFRVIQAAGAALLTPTSLGLILATAAPDKRHGAVRTWTAVGGAAAALGPVVGGLLVAARLALGLLRQRAGRPGRDRDRLAAAAERARASREGPGRHRRDADHCRRGAAESRAGGGQ